MNTPEWGARIERGIIDKKENELYKVRSLDRDGVVSLWIGELKTAPKLEINMKHDVNGETITEQVKVNYASSEYALNDEVYFFIFPDGRGAILGKIV